MSAKKPSQAATRAADRIVKETVVSLVCKEERDSIAAIIDEEISEMRGALECVEPQLEKIRGNEHWTGADEAVFFMVKKALKSCDHCGGDYLPCGVKG